MSAGVVPRPGRAATAPTALPLLAENQPECPSQPSTPLVAEHEQQLPALDRSLPTAQQLEQPAPSSPGAGTAHGWFSMWSHDLELDQLFYPLAAGMWLPYITRLWPVTTPAEHVQHVGQATAILLLAALAW